MDPGLGSSDMNGIALEQVPEHCREEAPKLPAMPCPSGGAGVGRSG